MYKHYALNVQLKLNGLQNQPQLPAKLRAEAGKTRYLAYTQQGLEFDELGLRLVGLRSGSVRCRRFFRRARGSILRRVFWGGFESVDSVDISSESALRRGVAPVLGGFWLILQCRRLESGGIALALEPEPLESRPGVRRSCR